MKKHLCVVDDDKAVRESLKGILEFAGYSVTLAEDGRVAQGKLDSPKVDLLILDLNMPNRNGWDVLEDVSLSFPLLPVIIITGLIDQLHTLDIPGVSLVLQKPIDVALFLNSVERVLAEGPEARLSKISASFEVVPRWTGLNRSKETSLDVLSGLPKRLTKPNDLFAE